MIRLSMKCICTLAHIEKCSKVWREPIRAGYILFGSELHISPPHRPRGSDFGMRHDWSDNTIVPGSVAGGVTMRDPRQQSNHGYVRQQTDGTGHAP